MDESSGPPDEPAANVPDNNVAEASGSESIWARCSAELFQAYLNYEQRAGNVNLSSPELRALFIRQHHALQSFPQPMMSYYSYIYAAVPYIPMPPRSPTGMEADKPFAESGKHLATMIDQVWGEIESKRQQQTNAAAAYGSGSNSPILVGFPAPSDLNQLICAQQSGDPFPQPSPLPTSPANASAKPDTLHGFANFIADYSAKHGITTDEAMAHMVYATSLYEVKQELIKDVTESLGAVSVNNEVLEELKPEGFDELGTTELGAGAGCEMEELPVSHKDIGEGEGQETEAVAQPADSDNPNEQQQQPGTPNEGSLVVPHSTSAPEHSFRTQVGIGFRRTGTYYMSPEQMGYATMRLPMTYTPPPYWSPPPQMYDQFGNIGYFTAPPAPLMRYPPMAAGLAARYAQGNSAAASEMAFGGPPMQLTQSFMPVTVTDQNKRGICPFCRRNGEDESVYRSHNLYQPGTRRVICPVLRRFKCELCGASGDHAHTRGYCKLYDGTNGNGNGNGNPPNQTSAPSASQPQPQPPGLQ